MSLYPRLVTHPHAACLFRKIVNFFHCLSVFSTILTAFSKVFSCFCKRPKICLLFNFYGTRQSSLPKCLICKTSMGILPLTFQRLLELLKIWQLKIHFVSLNISIVMQHISRFYSLAITQWLKCLKFCGILCKFYLHFVVKVQRAVKKKIFRFS